MKKEKTIVTKIVSEYLEEHPVLKDMLRRELLNYSAVAREIMKEASQRDIEISMGAVKMALFRVAENIKRAAGNIEERTREVIGESVIQVQTDLAIITIEKRKIIGHFKELSELMENARFFQITQGVEIFNVLVSREKLKAALSILGRDNIMTLTEGQTAIILTSPEENIRTPGFIYLLTSVLSYNGINITQIISCHKDTIFVFDRKDAIRAYDALENFILRFRK